MRHYVNATSGEIGKWFNGRWTMGKRAEWNTEICKSASREQHPWHGSQHARGGRPFLRAASRRLPPSVGAAPHTSSDFPSGRRGLLRRALLTHAVGFRFEQVSRRPTTREMPLEALRGSPKPPKLSEAFPSLSVLQRTPPLAPVGVALQPATPAGS